MAQKEILEKQVPQVQQDLKVILDLKDLKEMMELVLVSQVLHIKKALQTQQYQQEHEVLRSFPQIRVVIYELKPLSQMVK